VADDERANTEGPVTLTVPAPKTLGVQSRQTTRATAKHETWAPEKAMVYGGRGRRREETMERREDKCVYHRRQVGDCGARAKLSVER
jgi:hypothetical protein